MDVSFTAGMDWMATANTGGAARLWVLQTELLMDLACQVAWRNMTPAEWRQYVPGEKRESTCPNLPLSE